MTDTRPDETRADTALDREIKELLQIDPSPEFLARVRARVATEPVPGAWRFGWVPLAGGAAAVAVLGLAVVLFRPVPPVTNTADEPASTVARANGGSNGDSNDVGLPAPAAPTVESDGSPSVTAPPPAAAPTTVSEPAMPSTSSSEPRYTAVTPHVAPPPPTSAVVPPGPPQFARVVFSESEAATLRRLFTQVSEEGLIVLDTPESSGPTTRLELPLELEIPHVGIEPIALALLEGAVE
jgi:hypothetical protein